MTLIYENPYRVTVNLCNNRIFVETDCEYCERLTFSTTCYDDALQLNYSCTIPLPLAGLLAVLSLLHIASSAFERRASCRSGGMDSVGENLLNSGPESYDRFEEVLVRITFQLR